MAKDKKVWVAIAIAIAALVVAAPATFGAQSFAAKVSGYTTVGNVVYVSVANTTTTAQVGTVAVQAVVGGLRVTATAPFAVPAGGTAVVPVAFLSSPSKIISCGLGTEGGTPI